jgi:small conductance mechanosensitive channel
MNPQTTDFLVASRAAITQLTGLAVHYSLSLVGAILLFLVGWMLSRLLHRWTLNGLSRIRHFDVTLAHFLANVVRYAVLILVAVMALGQFGVQTTSIIATLGAAGLAIGLALQGTLQNIAAGIMLLILRPFRVGETIETPQVAGTVTEIGLFATELRTSDGLFQLAPNSALWNVPVKNYSRLPTRRYEVAVTVPATEDLARTEDRLLELARRDERILDAPAPVVSIKEFSAEAVTLALSAWVKTGDYGAATRDLTRRVKLEFDVKSDTAPVPAP